MMNKLILLILLILFNNHLYALDKDNIREVTFSLFSNENNINNKQQTKNGNQLEFEIFKRIYINKYINISSELGLYHYDSIYNTTTQLYSDVENTITLNEFLINISPNKNITYSFGQVPAQDGSLSSIRSNELKKSDFLYTIINYSGQGQFLRYKFSEYKNNFRISIGEIESKYYPLDNDIRFLENIKGTNGIYYLLGFNINKFEIVINRAEMDLRFNNTDFTDVAINALGITYDDSEETGLMLYMILGESKTKNKTIIIDTIYGPVSYKNTFGENGTSKLFGTKYKFSYNNNELYIGYEYLNQSKYWSGLSYGEPYSHSGIGDLGIIKTLYFGLDYNINTNILLQYQEKKIDTYINMQTLSQEDIDINIKSIKLQLKYLF